MNEFERNLNREERRSYQRFQKNVPFRFPERDHISLPAVDSLLEEETDLDLCQQELTQYKEALDQAKYTLYMYRFFRSLGVSEESIRKVEIYVLTDQSKQEFEAQSLMFMREIDPRKFRSSWQLYTHFKSKINRKKRYVPEDLESWVGLLEDREIPLEDLFIENIRSRKESVELLSLQIEWLGKKITQATQTEIVPEAVPAIQNSPEVVPERFVLSDWDLHWTDVQWSIEKNHLIVISTISREDAIEDLQEITRGVIMIKPSSVLRALEFHLSKDVIQRALATRLKYGPKELREWVKIKRGKDRIFLRVLEEGRAVVFARNRDVIYRNN